MKKAFKKRKNSKALKEELTQKKKELEQMVEKKKEERRGRIWEEANRAITIGSMEIYYHAKEKEEGGRVKNNKRGMDKPFYKGVRRGQMERGR